MQNGVFTGLFAALSTEHRMNNIANNLANVNTTGYKKDHLAFKDTMIQFAHDKIMEPTQSIRAEPLFPRPHIMARVRIAEAKTDHTQGGLQYTGSSLDMAISGDGFFQLTGPDGELLLTRNGSFTIQPDGTIVNKQGLPVVGDGGPLVVPPSTKTVHVSPDGGVFADNAQIGTLNVVTVDQLKSIEKIGGSNYRVREGTNPAMLNAFEGGALVNQGFLEASNVNVVEEMVKMIEVQRMFEATQKIMQTSDGLDKIVREKVGNYPR